MASCHQPLLLLCYCINSTNQRVEGGGESVTYYYRLTVQSGGTFNIILLLTLTWLTAWLWLLTWLFVLCIINLSLLFTRIHSFCSVCPHNNSSSLFYNKFSISSSSTTTAARHNTNKTISCKCESDKAHNNAQLQLGATRVTKILALL